MKVDNIFNLLNKFDKEEDRISAGFGFLLSNNKKLLKHFCSKINIALSRKELGKVDVETQVAYDSGKSRIDMQLTIYGRFLIFLESKIVKNENTIIKQLNKYAGILNSLRDQYDDRVRLIYVHKFPIDDDKKENILSQIRLDRDKLFLFSWEDLLKMTQQHKKGEISKQFNTYIGDGMFSKRIMKEQRIKDVVEVLVIHTNEQNWKLIQKKKIAVQRNGTPDAHYMAFYRTHRRDKDGKKLRQAITHISEVLSTETNVPVSETLKGVPELKEWYKETKRDLRGRHKRYNLGKLIKLEREIPFIKGGKPIGQVKFKTKMSELLRAKTISDLKRLKDL
ncbi:hypothetical protein MYX64_04035 [Nitrospinae bacterium AH_259_B05_G02_I21]|nr:hypothetical protein [Nitrospinae bacterium AH_259_B05_G02_I21]